MLIMDSTDGSYLLICQLLKPNFCFPFFTFFFVALDIAELQCQLFISECNPCWTPFSYFPVVVTQGNKRSSYHQRWSLLLICVPVGEIAYDQGSIPGEKNL